MSATSQLTTFSDLFTDLMNRVRVDTSQTATVTQAKRYINIALHDMHVGNGEIFPWAERQAILVTQPPYRTGTVAVSKGGTTITGTGTAWNTNNEFGVANVRAGGKIVIDGGTDVHEISTVANNTSATLTSAFTETTVTAATYEYFEDEYVLADNFLRPLDKQFFDQNAEIEIIGRREFRMRFPRNKITGKIQVATIMDKSFSGSATPKRRVRFYKPPDAAYSIPYAYVTKNLAVTSGGAEQAQLVGNDDEPIVPLIYRHAIVFHALYHWYRDKKNDDRSQEAKAEYVDIILRIAGDSEIGEKRPQIRPRITSYARAAIRPWSGRRRTSRFVTGTAFDEIR